MMIAEMQNMQTSKFPQKSMMGKNRTGKNIAGVLGDFLLQSSGYSPIYAPVMAQMRESQARQAEIEDKRAYDQQEWMRRKQYELNNPAPTELERQIAAAGIPQDRAKQILEQSVMNKSNPVQAVRVMNPDGSEEVRFMRVPNGVGGPPTEPVGELTIIGGPTPSASGGF